MLCNFGIVIITRDTRRCLLFLQGPYKSTYFAVLCFEVWLPRFTRGDPPRESWQPLSLFVAAKHNSRDMIQSLLPTHLEPSSLTGLANKKTPELLRQIRGSEQ